MQQGEILEEEGKRIDDMDYIKQIDRYGLFHLIERFPEQIEFAALEISLEQVKEYRDISRIGVVGVGTTTVCAGLLKTLVEREKQVPVISINGYSLPGWAARSTLLLFVSFSGNTEEVLSCFEQAIDWGCTSIVITTGGLLKKRALLHKIPIITIKKESPPNRTVLPYMLIPLLRICARMGLSSFRADQFVLAAQLLKSYRKDFTVHNETPSNLAKQLSLYCFNRIPLIYTDEPLYSSVLLRWRYQLNENAKMLAYFAEIPEMSHNEIIGLQGSGFAHLVAPIFILSKTGVDPKRERLRYTQSILKENGYSIMEVAVPGQADLERVLYGIYLGDCVSFYLAVLRGVDPHEVGLIDRLRLKGTEGT